MKICVSLGTISDVVGVQSEPPLHTGVQGVLGGEGKSAYKHVIYPLHMYTKSPTKQMILLFLQGKSL
jgi:hypothetical protein